MRFRGKVRLRPLRIGFLTELDDHDAIAQIVRLNTCLWGGAYNPIIPVFQKLPEHWEQPFFGKDGYDIARGYLRFFEPDVLVETRKGLVEKLGWIEPTETWRDQRSISLDSFSSEDERGRLNLSFGLDVLEIYESLFKSEYRFAPRIERNVAAIDPKNEGDFFLTACIGSFPNDGLLSKFSDYYSRAFDPKYFPNSPDSYLELYSKNYVTPINVSRHGLERRYNGLGYPNIFVFDPSNTGDLIDFWNLKQFESSVLPVNINWLDQTKDFLRAYIEKNFRPLPGNPHGVMIRTTIEFSRTISEERSKEIVGKYFSDLPAHSFARKNWYTPIWRDHERGDERISHPSRVTVTAAEHDFDVNFEDKSFVAFDGLSPEFSEKPLFQPAWANVITAEPYSSTETMALLYPTNILDPSFPDLTRDKWCAVTREGWMAPQSSLHPRIWLSLETGEEAIIAWLKEKNIHASKSASGRIADQIIGAVGGLTRLILLAHEKTLEKLNRMAMSVVRRESPTGEIDEHRFPDRVRPAKEWRDLIAERRKLTHHASITLDNMISSGILRIGLEVHCPHCQERNWYDLDTLGYQLDCARCLKKYPYPQANRVSERSWQFRVTGPFATPGFAQGGYSTALTLRAFASSLGGTENQITWTTALDLGAQEREIDFAFWHGQRTLFREHEEPVFVFGEAKSFGQNVVKDEDISRLKWLGEQLPEAFIVVSVLKRAFDDDEKRRLTELAIWGRKQQIAGYPRNPLIVLTGLELFAEYRISVAWKHAGGMAAKLIEPAWVSMNKLMTLADLTQQLYLGLQPFHDDYEKPF